MESSYMHLHLEYTLNVRLLFLYDIHGSCYYMSSQYEDFLFPIGKIVNYTTRRMTHSWKQGGATKSSIYTSLHASIRRRREHGRW